MPSQKINRKAKMLLSVVLFIKFLLRGVELIGEREVRAAKIWKDLSSFRLASGLSEESYSNFILILIAVFWVRRSSDFLIERGFSGDEYLFEDVEKKVGKLLSDTDGLVEGVDSEKFWDGVVVSLIKCVPGLRGERLNRNWPVPSSPDVYRLVIDRLRNFQAHADHMSLIDLFDEGFHRTVASLHGLPYRAGDAVAELASQLFSEIGSITELSSLTAEFAVLAWGKYRMDDLRSAPSLKVSPVEDLKFLVGLRLFMHGIAVRPFTDSVEVLRDGAILIDQPNKQPSREMPDDELSYEISTSMNVLRKILANEESFVEALVIVSGVDRTAKGWRREFREYLVSSGRVIAVVDLPPGGNNGKQSSAWLIAGEPLRFKREILVVDSKRLLREGGVSGINSLMSLVARVIAMATPKAQLEFPDVYHRSETHGEIEDVLDRLFRQGYRDIPGVCRLLKIEEVSSNDFKLSAAAYLHVEQSIQMQSWLSILDPSPIVETLRLAKEEGARIYVIGNNGEGKSILLNDLSQELGKLGFNTVGISFGLTDRFKFKGGDTQGKTFTYLGARTSERSISLGRTSADIIKMIKDIHLNQHLVNVFDRVVGHLGFGGRRYLIPTDLSRNPELAKSRYDEVETLSSDVKENVVMFSRLELNNVSLGLMRQVDDGTIIAFEELSSGEQQMLILAIKLTAYSNPNSVMLVDEPEISMHVSWQQALPNMLKIIGSLNKCSIVVATHSPIIVASANHSDDHCFFAQDRRLKELGRHQRRSVESALFDGFGTYTESNRQVHERCAEIVARAIRDLNATEVVNAAQATDSIASINEELDLMLKTIGRSESADLTYMQEDIDLVNRTRTAIQDVMRVRIGSNS